jgi:hypothetical protein
MAEKLCSKCGKWRCLKGYRFCSPCKTATENAMANSNYLTPTPSEGTHRGSGARESTYDTRKGYR